MFFNNFLPVFSIALTILAIAGGYVAFRQANLKQSSEIQDQTINALKTRVETLEGQIESDEKEFERYKAELTRLRQVISTVRHALKRRGLHIEIEGDVITLTDINAQSASSTKIPSVAKVARPVKLQPIVDNDDDDAS